MKQKIQILASLILIFAASTSCIFMGPSIKGNGKVVTEVRKTDDFDKIEASRGVNVYLTQGTDKEVVVKADENLLEGIKTKVEDNVLKIYSTERVRNAASFKVFVTNPEFSKISTSSGSNVFSEGVIKSDNLELSGSSGSNMKLKIDVEKCTASVSSGSNIKLRGRAGSFSGKASSGANLLAEKLVASKCTAKASSGANVWITAETDFDGHAGSGGNVFYSGNPKTVNTKESSGGNVIKK